MAHYFMDCVGCDRTMVLRSRRKRVPLCNHCKKERETAKREAAMKRHPSSQAWAVV